VANLDVVFKKTKLFFGFLKIEKNQITKSRIISPAARARSMMSRLPVAHDLNVEVCTKFRN
jgi:hypothetical protein